jgi:hypothetical protein
MRLLLSLIGAAVGGFLGVLAFRWSLNQGFYGIVLPGAMVGIGCGLLSRDSSLVRGLLCGVAGVTLGLYVEWIDLPFNEDDSLGYFVAHIHDLKPITLVMIGLGGLVAFWFGKGHVRGLAKGDGDTGK